MCYKGGPYCDKITLKRLERARTKYMDNPSEENYKARKQAQNDYDGTPAGQEELQSRIMGTVDIHKRNELVHRKDKSLFERTKAKERAKSEGRVPEMSLTHGLPASGKSTWAKEQEKLNPDSVRINRDDLREEFFGKEYHSRTPDYKSENFVTKVQEERVDKAFEEGKTPIIDDTNLKPKVVKNWIKIANEHGANIKHVYFDVELDELKRRNAERERVVPEVVYDMMKKGIRADGKTVKRFFTTEQGHIQSK